MKIGEFSQLTGIPIKTIRYYSDIGIIKPLFKDGSKYRCFGIEQLSQLNRIISLKESGFTLNEIMSMSEDEIDSDAMLRILETKLMSAKNEQKLANARVKNLQQRILNLTKRKGKDVEDKKIKVPPFNDTLLGLIKAVSDYYSLEHSDAMLYGGSGQAFLINIHSELCPSSPYVWNYSPFFKLLENLGIAMRDHGMCTDKDTPESIEKIEKEIIEMMKQGKPCGLANLENQMILGYDQSGFTLSQPWGGDFPGDRLTFGSWDEFGEDKFACFYSFCSMKKADRKQVFIKSLEYAVDLSENNKNHASEPYTAGIKSYDVFIQAVENGFGSTHGNLWNGTVWAECRQMAAEYFVEMKDVANGIEDMCLSLSKDFYLISEGLAKVSDKSVAVKPKIELLKEIKKTEEIALDKIKELLLLLR